MHWGVRGCRRLISRQIVVTMLVDQSTREKDRRATRLLRVAGDRCEVPVRVGGHGPWWVAGASVQGGELTSVVQQPGWDRRDAGVVPACKIARRRGRRTAVPAAGGRGSCVWGIVIFAGCGANIRRTRGGRHTGCGFSVHAGPALIGSDSARAHPSVRAATSPAPGTRGRGG